MEELSQRLKQQYNITLLQEDIMDNIYHWEFLTPYQEYYTIEITRLNNDTLELFGDVEAHTEYQMLEYSEIIEAIQFLLPQYYDSFKCMHHVMFDED